MEVVSLWTVCLSEVFPTMRKEELHIPEPARWASSPQYGTQTIGLLKVATQRWIGATRLLYLHTKISTFMVADTIVGAHAFRGGIGLPMVHLTQSRGCNSSAYTKNKWFTTTVEIQFDFPLLQQSVHEAGSPIDIILTNIYFSLYKILRHSCTLLISWFVRDQMKVYVLVAQQKQPGCEGGYTYHLKRRTRWEMGPFPSLLGLRDQILGLNM